MNANSDPNGGSASDPEKHSNSLSSLLSTLVPVFVVAFVWLLLFLLLRPRFKRYYQPRTFLGPEEARSRPLSDSLVGWISGFWNTPDTYILKHHTLDSYLLVRFLKIAVVSCVVGCCITWPVLFPINATGGGGHTQLDLLTMANVVNPYKLFAHAGCAIIFFSYILYTITRESIYYINLRQAYFMSPLYTSRISSRTVLFTSVPPEYTNKEKLREVLGPGVRRVWLATDCSDLQDKVDQRNDAAFKLEAAEVKLMRQANANRLKAQKKAAKKGGDVERQASDETAVTQGNGEDAAAQWLGPKDRPTHRLTMLIGKKVDTIDWCRAELTKLVPEVDALQAKHRAGDAKLLNSVFVEFETVGEAQAAFQSLTHHQALYMSPRFIGANPHEIIWSNLNITWWARVLRQIATTSFVVALVIFWSIPVAVVGAISNINYLIKVLPWLSFINNLPSVILGVVTGLLPVVALAVLMALLPIVLRMAAKIGGAPTLGAVELTVQNSYFAFQIVQVFLVATLSSAASSAVGQIIKDPTSVTSLLAQRLPLASNFYISYFVLQGLGIFSGVLVGLVGLVLLLIFSKFFDGTPRKMYRRWINLSGIGWGTVFPVYTNLFVIAICYAAIAPLVLGFAAVGLFFFYFAYRYNLMYVTNSNVNTGGLVYPRALQHLFIGLYVAEVCLIGLFAISVGTSLGALGPLILMILMLVFTALYQISYNSAIAPLLYYLPKTLEAEERNLLQSERNGEFQTGNGRPQEKGTHVVDNDATEDGVVAAEGTKDFSSRKKPNFFVKWLRPDVYNDYAAMRKLVPRSVVVEYTPEQEDSAYFNPAINDSTPLLWIPRDSLGMSATAVANTSKVIPMTDEGAYIDEKNKVVWNHDNLRPPIYQEQPYY